MGFGGGILKEIFKTAPFTLAITATSAIFIATVVPGTK